MDTDMLWKASLVYTRSITLPCSSYRVSALHVTFANPLEAREWLSVTVASGRENPHASEGQLAQTMIDNIYKVSAKKNLNSVRGADSPHCTGFEICEHGR